MIIIILIETGRKFFHVRYIKWSYRIRGNVARIQINAVANTIVFSTNIVLFRIGLSSIPVNKMAEVILMNKIFVYSAIKINANRPLPYSVLNPETSSDSPSAKSNGVRFVSANVVVNHIINIGKIINSNQDFCLLVIIDQSTLLKISRHEIRIRAILTSYEIVCATLRSLPNKAYLEFDDHPATNVGYTFILDTHRKYKIPNWKYIDWKLWGYNAHIIIAKASLIVGAIKNRILFDIVGLFCSFTKSLIASANGWATPIILGLFGPFRKWKYPKNFRSIKVKNAIATTAIKYLSKIEMIGVNNTIKRNVIPSTGFKSVA